MAARKFDIENMTKQLYKIPFASNPPDPMDVSFAKLERNVRSVVEELWKSRQIWGTQASLLDPIWLVSLRMTAMYLNMSPAFYGCGSKFILMAQKEPIFLERYENASGKSDHERASRMLARVVRMLRMLGFKSPVIAISGDYHYYGSCKETRELLERLT